MPIPGDIFTKALALLAFAVAFYTLIARERKTPYIINFIYSSAFWVFFALIINLTGQFIGQQLQNTSFVWISDWILYLSNVLLFIGGIRTALGIWRIHNRQIYFRDDIKLKFLTPYRWYQKRQLAMRDEQNYELDAPKLLPELKEVVTSCHNTIPNLHLSGSVQTNGETPRCIIFHGASLIESDQFIIELVHKLMIEGEDWTLQYTTCIRHPYELMNKLKDSWEKTNADVRKLYKQIVVVDAYTPHFGFIDKVHVERTANLKKLGIHCVTSSPSFAGIHTATARAFNKLKKQNKEQNRPRTLIIYEGAFALIDLESIEQYRIFVRHVLPSERMWDGMLTCMVEPEVNDSVLPILTTYADVTVEKVKSIKENTNDETNIVLTTPEISKKEVSYEVK